MTQTKFLRLRNRKTIIHTNYVKLISKKRLTIRKILVINSRFRSNNFFIVPYFNDDRFEYISESNFIDKLQLYKRRLEIFPDMDYGYFKNYNKNVYSAIALTEELNSLIFSLPPFDKILDLFNNLQIIC